MKHTIFVIILILSACTRMKPAANVEDEVQHWISASSIDLRKYTSVEYISTSRFQYQIPDSALRDFPWTAFKLPGHGSVGINIRGDPLSSKYEIESLVVCNADFSEWMIFVLKYDGSMYRIIEASRKRRN